MSDSLLRHRKAIHESGHAVARWFYHWAIERVTLDGVTGTAAGGFVSSIVQAALQGHDLHCLPKHLLPQAETYSVVAWAGWAANRCEEGAIGVDHLVAFGATRDAEEVVALAQRFIADADGVQQWVSSMQSRALKLIAQEDLWKAVVCLADEVEARGLVLGAEAESIILAAGAHRP